MKTLLVRKEGGGGTGEGYVPGDSRDDSLGRLSFCLPRDYVHRSHAICSEQDKCLMQSIL